MTLASLLRASLALVCLFPQVLRSQSDLLSEVVLQQVASGLFQATSIAHAGDGSGRLFVTRQQGEIHVIDNGVVRGELFLDLRGRVSCCGERGLLGLAFHPNFISNGFFYVNYTDPRGDTVVARFRVSEDDSNIANPDSESLVLNVEQPTSQHNGGQLAFGPDGFLYIGLGDGGPGGAGNLNAQQLGSLLGSILRIDADSAEPYAVPASNPFVGRDEARDEIWVYGLRNPWRFSFDRLTGEMFIGDVGQRTTEEIDHLPTGSLGGTNFGWNLMEGTTCSDGSDDCNILGEFELPILEYSHDAGCSVTGGYVYRGEALAGLQGHYLFSDFCSGVLSAARQQNGVWEVAGRRETGLSVTTFGEDESGGLYVAGVGGSIFRLAPAQDPPEINSFYPGGTLAGGDAFSLYLAGSNFVTGVEVFWMGQMRPVRIIDDQRIELSVSAMDISQPGTVTVTVSNPALPGASASIEFPIDPTPAISPRINPGGVVTAAGFLQIPLTPGSIASVFGRDMTASIEITGGLPLPTNLGGAALVIGDGFPVPIIFASPRQMNVQIPWEVALDGEAELRVRLGEKTSEPVAIPLAAHSPAVFTLPQVRAGQGAILIANTAGVIAAPGGSAPGARPVRKGELLEIYATGLGPVSHRPESGAGAPAFPLARTETQPIVTMGGASARVLFSGLAAGAVGLNQINVRVAEETPSGDDVSVVIRIGGVESVPVVVAVE